MILNDKKGKLIIFLVIILIASITPATAALIHEAQSTNNSTDLVQNKMEDVNTNLDVVEEDMNEIQEYTNSLNGDLNYIKNRARDYNWKFWKWSGISKDIMGALRNLVSNAKKLEKPANKLTEDALKLKETATLLSNTQDSNPTNYEDANQMAGELGKHFNTTFTAETVSANDVKKGDIVQYISQGKYPRYLKVVDIIYPTNNNQANTNTTQNNSKRTQDGIDTATPILILEGVGTILVQQELSQYMGLKSIKNINTNDIEQEVFQEQQNEINEDKEHAGSMDGNIDNLEKTTEDIGIMAAVMAGFAAVSFLIAAALLVIAVFTLNPELGVPAGQMVVLGTVCLGIAGVIVGLTIILIGVRAVINSIYKNLNKKIEPEQRDLETYTQSKNEANMDVSTFDGVPIVKQPLDWKNYESLDTPRAEHGDVLMGPGTQFLYGPYEGYTGEDHFRIYALPKNSINPILVNVKITIQPIPTFTIPAGA